jgi:hypothetical protein
VYSIRVPVASQLSLRNKEIVFPRALLYLVLGGLALQGALRIIWGFKINPVNPSFAMDCLIILLGLKFWKGRVLASSLFAFFLITVFFFYITIALVDGNSMTEAIKASKWIGYLGIFYGISTSGIPEFNQEIFKITKFLTLALLISYSYQFFLIESFGRPYLITENNYEIGLLTLLFVTCIQISTREELLKLGKWIPLLIGVGVLGQSKSGTFSIVVVVLFYVSREYKFNASTPLKFLLLISSASLSFFALSFLRGISLSGTDREYFFYIFRDEIFGRNIFESIFGNGILQPLSTDSCTALIYFALQLIPNGNGVCYSVIFHSFILRLIIDFGFFGLIFCFVALVKIYQRKTLGAGTLFFIAIIVINSISVSGLNNPYIALPTLIYFCLAKFNRENLGNVN